jgi:hypothetical protein
MINGMLDRISRSLRPEEFGDGNVEDGGRDG